MPINPAIKPTIRPAKEPPPDLPEWEVRLTMDVTKRIRAMDEDQAQDMAWEQALNNGELDMEVNEIPEDENGAS